MNLGEFTFPRNSVNKGEQRAEAHNASALCGSCTSYQRLLAVSKL